MELSWHIMVPFSTAGKTGHAHKTGFFKIMAQVFNQAAVGTLLLMCILLAKGWTIVRRKLRARARVRIGVYMTVYASIALMSIAWTESSYKAGLVIYFYAMPPGIILGALRGGILIWFSYATFITVKNYPNAQRRLFYTKFYSLFVLWIVALPIQVI